MRWDESEKTIFGIDGIERGFDFIQSQVDQLHVFLQKLNASVWLRLSDLISFSTWVTKSKR